MKNEIAALTGYDDPEWIGNHLDEKHAIEKYVRRKNAVYRKWRSEHTFKELDTICAEMLMLFGGLPQWGEFVMARRTRDFHRADQIEKLHVEWKGRVRRWAFEKGYTRFPTQSAQLLKFYFAWFRFRYEERNGMIKRKWGRQMG